MKRLICICNNRQQYEDWCRVAGIPAFAQHIALTMRNQRTVLSYRALSETAVALVHVSPRALTDVEHKVLDIYIALGAPQFDAMRVSDIKAWLGVEETREKKLETALAEALGMLRTISMFMLKYPEADTVAAKVRAWEELLK